VIGGDNPGRRYIPEPETEWHFEWQIVASGRQFQLARASSSQRLACSEPV